MFRVLYIVTVLIVVLAIVPAVAHTLELSGKMRLSKDEYAVMQRVYPGFTVAGLAELERVMKAMLQMQKIDIKKLKAAYTAK